MDARLGIPGRIQCVKSQLKNRMTRELEMPWYGWSMRGAEVEDERGRGKQGTWSCAQKFWMQFYHYRLYRVVEGFSARE